MSAEAPSAAPGSSPQGDRRALYVLLAVVFVNIAGFGVIIPLLPFYAKSFGAPDWQVFVLFAAYSVGNFFAEPLWGRLSDRIGRRPVLMMTIFGNALTYVLLAFALNLWVACAIRLLGGVLTGNISTIQGYMADITPPDRRAGMLGLMGAAFSLGFMTGPSIGGLLAHAENGTAGFRTPLLFAACLAVAAGVGVILFVRETRHVHKDAPRRGRLEGLNDAFANPVVWRALTVTLISMAGFAGMEATFGLWGEARFGWGPRQIGFCFLVIAITAAFAQGLLAGAMAKRFGEPFTLMAGLALIFLGFGLQPLVHSWPLAVVGMITVAFGQSLAFPNLGAIISKSVDPDRQGEMMGLNTAAGALARIIGPLSAAPIFAMFGPNGPFAVAAALCIPALFMAWQVSKAVRRSA
ncbi:MAG: MFS transporter [Caulobacter sp.]|nr:MFS transporter [Caulobacter sp.]